MKSTILTSAISAAKQAGFVRFTDKNFKLRAARAFNRNLADPGDCAGDEKLLAGLAVAQAEIGIRTGWLPEVQRIGVAIAELI